MEENEVTLKEYIHVRLNSIEKATDLAWENLKARLESLNEWRLQNKDERALPARVRTKSLIPWQTLKGR
jgi:hypothetical protein